jgi:predicted MPP superfamily phosphohydrolase
LSHQHIRSNSLEKAFFGALVALAHSPAGIRLFDLARLPNPNGRTDWVDTTQLDLEIKNLNPSFDGYRIVQISDIHLGTWVKQKQFSQVIDLVNQQNADLIAITGDFVTHHPERYVDSISAALRQLSSKDGCLTVLGNHDHWTDANLIRQAINQGGGIDLNNDVHLIQRGAEGLYFAGLDDQYVNYDRMDLVLNKLPDGVPAILLAHEPDIADASARTGRFALQISGHSHGGQIRLPGARPVFLPHLARKYPQGLYQIDEMYLYSNRGLGTAEIQIRLNCRPEITVYNLIAPRKG